VTADGYYRVSANAGTYGQDSFTWAGTNASGATVQQTVVLNENATQAVLSDAASNSGSASAFAAGGPLAGVHIASTSLDMAALDKLDGIVGNSGGAWLGVWEDAQGAVHFRLDIRPNGGSNSELFSLTGSAPSGTLSGGSVHAPTSVSLSVGGDSAAAGVASGWFSDNGTADPIASALAGMNLTLALPQGWVPPVGGNVGAAASNGAVGGGNTSWFNIPLSAVAPSSSTFDANAGNILVAAAGDDTLSGGTGNDTFVANGGHDVFTGGGGTDAVVLHGAASSWTLAQNASGTGWIATDAAGDAVSMAAIDHVAFSDGAVIGLSHAAIAESGGAPAGGLLGAGLSNAHLVSGPANADMTLSSDGYYTISANAGTFGHDAFTWAGTNASGAVVEQTVALNETASGQVLSMSPSNALFAHGGALAGFQITSSNIDTTAIDRLDGTVGNSSGGWLGVWEDAQGGVHFRLDLRPDGSSNHEVFTLTGAVDAGTVAGHSATTVTLSVDGDAAASGVASGYFSDNGTGDPIASALAGMHLTLSLPQGWIPPVGAAIGTAASNGAIGGGNTCWFNIPLSAVETASTSDPGAGEILVATSGGGSVSGGAGNDILVANGGNVTMTGGGGVDQFVLHAADHATITDFSVSGGSALDFSGVHAAAVAFSQQSDGVHVSANGVDLAILQHVSLSDFGGAASGAEALSYAETHHNVGFS